MSMDAAMKLEGLKLNNFVFAAPCILILLFGQGQNSSALRNLRGISINKLNWLPYA